jgi:hypothetical protein
VQIVTSKRWQGEGLGHSRLTRSHTNTCTFLESCSLQLIMQIVNSGVFVEGAGCFFLTLAMNPKQALSSY